MGFFLIGRPVPQVSQWRAVQRMEAKYLLPHPNPRSNKKGDRFNGFGGMMGRLIDRVSDILTV